MKHLSVKIPWRNIGFCMGITLLILASILILARLAYAQEKYQLIMEVTVVKADGSPYRAADGWLLLKENEREAPATRVALNGNGQAKFSMPVYGSTGTLSLAEVSGEVPLSWAENQNQTITLIVDGGILKTGNSIEGMEREQPPASKQSSDPAVNYNLSIEGKVTDKDGNPGAVMSVILRTDTGEVFETETDITGKFLLEASTNSEQGMITVKSAFNEDMIYGQMALTWAAGGGGEKKLVADLVMDKDGEMTVQGGGTEFPLPDEPGNDEIQSELPSLPTATPPATVDVTTTVVLPVDATPSPTPSEDNGATMVVVVVMGILGVSLTIGGILFVFKNNNWF